MSDQTNDIDDKTQLDQDQNEFSSSQLPPWYQVPLPFMVVVKDESFTITQDLEAETVSNNSQSSSSKRDSIESQSSLNYSSGVAFSPSHHSRNIYPEIRYVFSDDDFAPTIDVLDSTKHEELQQQQQAKRADSLDSKVGKKSSNNSLKHKSSKTSTSSQSPQFSSPSSSLGKSDQSPDPNMVSLIIDFDKSGTNVVNATSLSPFWQISNVTEKVKPTAAQTTGRSLSPHPTTPAWASENELNSTVGHVLYVHGTRPNPHFDLLSNVSSIDSGNIKQQQQHQQQQRRKSKSSVKTIPQSDDDDDDDEEDEDLLKKIQTKKLQKDGKSSLDDNNNYFLIKALTKQFEERNNQLRQMIDSLNSHSLE